MTPPSTLAKVSDLRTVVDWLFSVICASVRIGFRQFLQGERTTCAKRCRAGGWLLLTRRKPR